MAREETPIADLMRSLWRHRPGQEIPAAVLDVIDALGLVTMTGVKPVICFKARISNGWHIVLNLPPGIATDAIEKNLRHFEEQTRSVIVYKAKGNKAMLTIRQSAIPSQTRYVDLQAPSKMQVTIPLGVGIGGPVWADLAEVINILSAGIQGSGKTNWLRHFVATVLIKQGVAVAVADPKMVDFPIHSRVSGGMEFSGIASCGVMALGLSR